MSEGWAIFLIGEAIIIFGGLLAIYVRVNVKLAELDLRMKVSEKRTADMESKEDKMNLKLDAINDKINMVLVELQNKANR